MTLDTVERQKYFGLRNVRSCGFCRLRNGRSCTRRSHRQDPQLMSLLFGWATREAHTRALISQRARAREKLLRHGWKYDRPCQLFKFAKECLVDVPELPTAAYKGLVQADRLHAFFIAYCSYCMECLSECVKKEYYNTVHQAVQDCHQFRDPKTGKVHPRLTSVLQMSHLTAERRVRAIFYWAHVLGTKAEVIVPPMRQHALAAVSTLQLILISTRGHRSYSRRELDVIYLDAGKEFFKNLETMRAYLEDQRIDRVTEAHERNPTRVNPPLPFKRPRRCVL